MKTISNDIFFAHVESEISAGRSVRIKVKGYSMYPLLRNGIDEVVIHTLTKEPHLLDIVLFKYNGKYILHRIVDRDGANYIIQGDGIYASQEQCTLSDIVGTVTSVIKNGSKQIDCKSFLYRQYSIWWYYLRICRRLLLAVLRRMYK